jgi:hypothetical protein
MADEAQAQPPARASSKTEDVRNLFDLITNLSWSLLELLTTKGIVSAEERAQIIAKYNAGLIALQERADRDDA